jgi:hypothetical protein
MLQFGNRECSDIRDRVYSLLSIFWTQKPLLVDYSIDNHTILVGVVYRIDWENAARQDMEKCEHFEHFVHHFCQYPLT